jgi:type II secretory pathway predicted ATPase ExeA
VATSHLPKRTLTYGGRSKRAVLAEELALPVLQDLDIQVVAIEALDRAASERKGFALIGKKGTGKTMAITRAIEDFERAERRRMEDTAYQSRGVLRLQAPRSAKYAEILDSVHRALTGDSMLVKRRGARILPDKLRQDLVQQLVLTNTAVLVIDEAEHLSDEGLTVLRDLMSEAESTHSERLQGDAYKAVGIGMVLVGTRELARRLKGSEERGRRWVYEYHADLLQAETVAAVYRAFLPACDDAAKAMGDDAWVRFVRQHLAPSGIPVSRIENHVRHYVRRWTNHSDQIRHIKDVPYDEAAFLGTWSEVAGGSDRGDE